MPDDLWLKAGIWRYRELLFGVGEQRRPGSNGQRVKRGISRERVEEVLAKKGKLPRWEMLWCRMRYFWDGAVPGAGNSSTKSSSTSVTASARSARPARARCATWRPKGSPHCATCAGSRWGERGSHLVHLTDIFTILRSRHADDHHS